MLRWFNSRRGQNTAEYAILIGVIVAAAIAMQLYIRRGMQARVKDAVDYTKTGVNTTGDYACLFQSAQYEPYYMNTTYDTVQQGTTNETAIAGGMQRSYVDTTTQRVGNQVYANYMMANQI